MANTFSQISSSKQKFLGIPTICSFDLVTSAPMQWTESVRMKFTDTQSTSNDYLSSDTHTPQFSQSSGAVFVDGDSYDNKFIAKNAQFIAPQEGYVKSVQGYIVASGSSNCEEETITISVWSKTADVSGTSDTPMNLIFSQSVAFNAPNNQLVLAIDSKLYGSYNKLTMNEGEGVIFSVKRETGEPCVTCQATMTMIFESNENQATQDNFRFATEMTEMGGVNENVIARRDVNYKAKSSGLPTEL